MPHKPPRADIVAMVRGIGDRGRFPQPGCVESTEDLADIVIEPGAQSKIGGYGAQTLLFVRKLRFAVHERILLVDPWMPFVTVTRMQFHRWQPIGWIEIVKPLRHDQGEMRSDQPHEQAPGPVVLFPGGDPFLSALDNGRIIIGIFAVAGSDIITEHAPCPADPFVLATDGRPDHADAAGHHHGNVLDVKSGRILLRAVVQLADGFDRDAGFLQGMAPAGNRAVIGHCIVPKPVPVDIAARGEGGPGRHADRRWRVGIRKAHPTGGETVQIGRQDAWVPGTAHGPRLVFV